MWPQAVCRAVHCVAFREGLPASQPSKALCSQLIQHTVSGNGCKVGFEAAPCQDLTSYGYYKCCRIRLCGHAVVFLGRKSPPLVLVLNCCDLSNPRPCELLSQSIYSHFCMERMIVTWRQVQRPEHIGFIQFHF